METKRETDVFINCTCGFVLVVLIEDTVMSLAGAIERHMRVCPSIESNGASRR